MMIGYLCISCHSKVSRSKWLPVPITPRIVCTEIKNQGNPKEERLKPIPITRVVATNPLTKEAPPNPGIVFAKATLPLHETSLFPLTDSSSEIPSSILSDLSPQLAEQLNCPIFDLELGPQVTQDLGNDLELNMFGLPNANINSSKLDCEDYQDLNEWCNPISTSPPQTLTIDYNYERVHPDEMANMFKNNGFEGISDDQNITFDPSDCISTVQSSDILKNESNSSMCFDIEEGVVYDDVLINGFSNVPSVLMGVDVDQSYPNSPNNYEINFEETSMSLDLKTSTNATLQMTNDVQFIPLISSATSSDNIKQKMYEQFENEDSLEKYQVPEDMQIPLMSQTKDEDNNKLINDVIHGYYNNVIINNSQETRKHNPRLNLILDVNDSDDDPFVSKPIVTTPELYDTIEELEAESPYPFKQEKKSSSVSSYQINSVKSELSEVDFFNLTPPNTPLEKVSRRKRRNSEDIDSTYVPLTKKSKSDLPSYSTRKVKTVTQNINFDEPLKTKRCGRPPKPIKLDNSPYSSFTDDSLASPDDIERIKRERNNEASRRSRQNRKMKQMETFNEAVILEKKNEEHKKQIEKLDKKITYLKKNLINIMSSK